MKRKTTVKEVKKWFKTLEENRYKKTYASDARRVSWIVNNNLSEDYESMPVSMRKKWSKAQYGREKFLAKEFVKHKENIAKLRESIRKIVGGLINEQKLLKEGRDTLIKKQTVKTPFGNLKFEVWEIMSGPGQSSMLSFDIEFNGANIQDTTIEGKSGGMAEVRHQMRAKKVKFK